MVFLNYSAFYILFLLVVLIFVKGAVRDYERYFSTQMLQKIIIGAKRKRVNFILLLSSFILLVVALARPVIQNKPIKIPQSTLSIIVAFDLSLSMQCEDVYPNRLAFAKNKFNNLLVNLKDEKIGALGFSSKAFLIAPITNDYLTLKYLVKNIDLSYISAKGSSIQEALINTNELLQSSQKKALIVFTDGTDKKEFNDEIKYAKKHNIKVFIYAVASKKGGVIKTKQGVQKDKNNNIVITSLNPNIKQLALETSGAYLEFSTSSDDIKLFLKAIKEQFKAKIKKDVIIKNNQELYYIPLGLALLLFFIAVSGTKGIKR
jgi:Ca-activated chloride channel family protein